MKKKFFIIGCILCTLLFNQVVFASENSNDNVYDEYVEKKDAGKDVIELKDENGNFLGYYEDYSDNDRNSVLSARYGSRIEWKVLPGKTVIGENRYTLGEGYVINLNITQSRVGTSYIRFLNRSTGTYIRFEQTKTTNGWSGRIILSRNVTNGLYSFGIQNASANTITYTGTYSL